MNYELIKVCGMREADNIRVVDGLPVDWLGLIFWPKSSRYVAAPPAYLPTQAKRVGVFVNSEIEDVLQHVKDYCLDAVQLHGHESPDYICALAAHPSFRRGAGDKVRIIKAISVNNRDDVAVYRTYNGLVDYFLFDTRATVPANNQPANAPASLPGGSGRQFDWKVLAAYAGETPFLLSGGIGPDDADRLRAFHHPRCIGIDLNSRFETAPGLKDANKLREFIKKIRQ